MNITASVFQVETKDVFVEKKFNIELPKIVYIVFLLIAV